MNMLNLIKIIGESLLFSIAVVFFMFPPEKKKLGFLSFFSLEVIYRWIGILLIASPYPEIRAQKVVLYLIYMILRMLWFVSFTEHALRNYLEIYFTLFTGTILLSLSMGIVAEKYNNLMFLVTGSVETWNDLLLYLWIPCMLSLIVSIALLKADWLKKFPTHILQYAFLFVIILGEITLSIIYYSEKLGNFIIMIFLALQLLAILISIQYAYLKQQNKVLEEENNQLEQYIQNQYRYYQNLRRKEEEIKIIRHDLANHLQIVHKLETRSQIKHVEEYKTRLRNSYLKAEDMNKEISERNSSFSKENPINKSSIFRYIILFLVINILVLFMLLFFNIRLKMNLLGIVSIMGFESLGMLWIALLEKRYAQKKHTELKSQSSKTIIDTSVSDPVNILNNTDQELNAIMQIEQEEELLQKIDDFTFQTVTGCPELDIMLHQKQRYCLQNSIQLEIHLDIPKEKNLNIANLIGLLSNLLDNAIEACERVEFGKKYVKLDSQTLANIWSVKIENSKNPDENPEQNHFLTTKSDKEIHGIGMKIIHRIVNKYHGTIQYQNERTIFTIVVNLQI